MTDVHTDDTTRFVDPQSRTANPYDGAVARNPHPFYRALRAHCPIAQMTGMPDTHIISRYEDVRFALQHPEIFSSSFEAVDIGQDRPLIPLQIDPPDHAKYRKVMDPHLAMRHMTPMEPEVRALVNRLIDGFAARGSCDAHAEFTVPLPSTVFVELCDLDDGRLEDFLRWKDNIIRPQMRQPEIAFDPEAQAAVRHSTAREIYEFFDALIAERLANPGDDVISRFALGEVDGQRMTHEQMLDVCFLFILGGLDTVTSTLDCSLAYLAQHPDRRDRIVADPSLIPAAVEELLRLHTPVMQILRVVAQPYEMHGVQMNPGDHVIVMLGSADTDPDEFGPAADELVLDREVNRHLAFGGGPHRCLGSNLARFELRIALEEWHRRIPRYEIAEGATLHYSPGIREIEELPLIFDPEAG
jgi:cytochrome P450